MVIASCLWVNQMIRAVSTVSDVSMRIVKIAMRVGAGARALSSAAGAPLSVSGVGSSAPSAAAVVSAAGVSAAPASADGGAAQTGAFGLRYEVRRIEAVRRETVGKRNAQWTRMNGLVPGLIYGPGVRGDNEPIRVYVTEADLRAVVNKSRDTFLNTLFDIVVDGVVTRVIVRDFQMHPFKPKFISCNWFRYRPGRYPGVKVDLPLRAINEERCPAFKEGGWLLELIHKLPVFASGDEIPDAVVYDLRGKRMGEKIMASDIVLSSGLSLVRFMSPFAAMRHTTNITTNSYPPPHPSLHSAFATKTSPSLSLSGLSAAQRKPPPLSTLHLKSWRKNRTRNRTRKRSQLPPNKNILVFLF